MRRLSSFIFIGFFLQFARAASAEDQLTGEDLVMELGCPACHEGWSDESNIQDKAPDLSQAGLRFSSAYLFNYLQNPTRIRQHIGLSRMPNFRLSEKESLALTLFLEKQVQVTGQWSDFPPELNRPVKEVRKQSSSPPVQSLINQYECTKCHQLEDVGEKQSIDLSTVGFRLKPDWIKKYMAAPYMYDGLQTKMPSYFYEHDVKQKKFVEMLPQPAQRINELTKYLFSLNTKKQAELWRTFEDAKTAHPDVDAGLGAMIFVSLNCGACHKYAGELRSEKNAPDLRFEGARVKKEWLKAYFKRPASIRPFGFHPGSGSRMPDFNLSDKEVDILTDYFFDQKGNSKSLAQAFSPRKLSAFSLAKAEALLKEKLPCLGCHQLGSEGGRIAPNLSGVKTRLQDAFVYQFIQNPKLVLPETVMPAIPMPEKTLDLVVNYLLQNKVKKRKSSYLSLIDNAGYFYKNKKANEKLYLKYCASCHGLSGRGDGFNAKYLKASPTVFSDSVYLSKRPDNTLFDGIFAGGYILNKSHLMPPWGYTLDDADIWNLVSYIRELCNCDGPHWSTDNK